MAQGGSEADTFTAIFRPLATVDETTPGWVEIQETAIPDSGLLASIRRAIPVRAGSVRSSLETDEDLTFQSPLIVVANTIAFARNVLEAERNAHYRAQTLGFDRADVTMTGPHAAMKQAARQHGEAAREADQKAAALLAVREELPVDHPDRVYVVGDNRPTFHGFAELYGMARAGFDIHDLATYFANTGIVSIPERTQEFLRNTGRIVRALNETPGPVAQLGAIGVHVAAAMTIAESPTRNTVFGTALQIGKGEITP